VQFLEMQIELPDFCDHGNWMNLPHHHKQVKDSRMILTEIQGEQGTVDAAFVFGIHEPPQ
jgi:hypothetical protein